MRIVIADPPAYTPWYDHELARAVAAEGVEVELATSRFRFSELPPADGATVKGSPANLSLTLSHAMVFRSVQLRTAAGQRVPLNATLPTTMVKTVTIPVRPLSPGQYIVEWRAESGHEMVGSFSFTVQ